MRIDAHLHFWQPSCGFDNRPIADHAAYRRDFLPEHVLPDLDACHIDAVLLVQTCPQVEETRWLLELAARTPRVLGVTAWMDLDPPDADFTGLAEDPRVIGIRAQLRRIADPAFVTRPNVVANLAAALRCGFNVTLLAEPRHYDHVIDVLPRLPAGPVTLNHLGLPFPDVDRASWRALMRGFARRPNSYVQLSGLPFLHGEQWRTPAAHSLMDEALDILGPQRLLFASDWPMLLRFATYGDWVRAVETFLDERRLTRGERAAIFGDNAVAAHPRLAARMQEHAAATTSG
ncbi:MAG TPA: amidohydrolase family protein [Casimicrobiaceae bacterium]|nr:amidohydrolase family protein [Casimicrobiaceae bacterium]